MKNIMLVTNSSKDVDEKYAGRVIDIIENNGAHCVKNVFSRETADGMYIYADPKQVPDDTELIVVLGGDGTFIHASKDLVNAGIPILGVNIGHLGYLTETNISGFENDFKLIQDGKYLIETRMLLHGKVIRNGNVIKDNIALNDIVFTRVLNMNVMDFDVYVNEKFMNSYSADGYIISTPTGSTGYNLSAGGPVAHPTANVIITTPICAHTLNSRSVVFSAEDTEIDVIVKSRQFERNQQKLVSFDGDTDTLLENGDIVKVRRSKKVTKNLRLDKMSFIEHLGKQMR